MSTTAIETYVNLLLRKNDLDLERKKEGRDTCPMYKKGRKGA